MSKSRIGSADVKGAFFSFYSASHAEVCWLLLNDDGQREKGPSLQRPFRARSTTSGMWSVSILGLIKMLRKAVSLDQSARYRTWEKQDLWKGLQVGVNTAEEWEGSFFFVSGTLTHEQELFI